MKNSPSIIRSVIICALSMVLFLICLMQSAAAQCDGVATFTDARDGQIYKQVTIGTQCWMAENLNIGTMINVG